MSRHLVSLLFTFVCFALVDICDAEVLHSWVEANPNHAFQNGDIVEYPLTPIRAKVRLGVSQMVLGN